MYGQAKHWNDRIYKLQQPSQSSIKSVNESPVRSAVFGPFRILTTTDRVELDVHAAAWDNLAYETAQPMLSHAWISSFFEYQLDKEQDWLCLLAFRDTQLVGVLPLVCTVKKILGKEHLNLWTPFNWHTPCVNFLVKPNLEDEVIPLILEALNDLTPSFSRLKIRRLPERASIMSITQNCLPDLRTIRRYNGNGSYIEVRGTFEDYRACLQTSFARNLNRLERKLEKLGNLHYDFITENTDDIKYLDTFLQIEASCWKGRNNSAISKCPSYLDFYKALTRRLARLGWLEWHFLTAGGKTIAANLAIRVNRRLVMLKIGYDEEYSSYSPGSKLFEKMIERAFDSGVIDEIDCLSEYPWNRNWKMQTKSYYDLSIYSSRPNVFLGRYLPEKLYHLFCRLPLLNYPCHVCHRMINRLRLKPDPKNKTCCSK